MTRADQLWIAVVLVSLAVRAYFIESDIKKLKSKVEELEKQSGGKN